MPDETSDCPLIHGRVPGARSAAAAEAVTVPTVGPMLALPPPLLPLFGRPPCPGCRRSMRRKEADICVQLCVCVCVLCDGWGWSGTGVRPVWVSDDVDIIGYAAVVDTSAIVGKCFAALGRASIESELGPDQAPCM